MPSSGGRCLVLCLHFLLNDIYFLREPYNVEIGIEQVHHCIELRYKMRYTHKERNIIYFANLSNSLHLLNSPTSYSTITSPQRHYHHHISHASLMTLLALFLTTPNLTPTNGVYLYNYHSSKAAASTSTPLRAKASISLSPLITKLVPWSRMGEFSLLLCANAVDCEERRWKGSGFADEM
jgi:hypothetical protein